jgi:type IV secretion system protein VirB11
VKAWNTGHPGGLATIHANNAAAGLVRVAQLIEEGLQGGDAKPRVIAEAVGLIVVIAKVSTAPGRRITEMVSVKGHENGRYILEPVLSAS